MGFSAVGPSLRDWVGGLPGFSASAGRRRPSSPVVVSLPNYTSKEKFPQHKDEIPKYFFGGDVAAPGADFR